MSALVYSLKDVADKLGCGLSKIYTLIETKKLDARRMLGRTVVTNDELQRFIADLPPVELGKSHLKGKPRKDKPLRAGEQPRRGAA